MEKPSKLDPLAEKVLSYLVGQPAAGEIVLGGYFALRHYVDYRQTHDIDAWWKTRASSATEAAIGEAMKRAAVDAGLSVRQRRFGDTLSFELVRDDKRVFSFQIAVRSVGLDAPQPSPWPPILIETLADNIGSKMNALVDRGSPRDFTDIRQVVESGLMSIERCWELWSAKNVDSSLSAAKQNVLMHLAALESRRPLESIANPSERQRAQATQAMSMHIDQSVYPDLDSPPTELGSIEEKADYLQRICAAWEFGVPPDPQTFDLFSTWKEVFDRFPLPASPAYHAMRAWFGWEAIPFPAHFHPPVPRWLLLDQLEGRPPDPCEQSI